MKWLADGSYSTYVNGLDKDTYPELYYISTSTNAYGMWLASSSADNSSTHGKPGDFVYYANGDGNVGSNGCSNGNGGFRPLVCLKSNVRLERQNDGSYKIK